MRRFSDIIPWSIRNVRIVFLIVGCLFITGIYALVHIPKQEFPEYTIRQGVVAAIYPGATTEEVETQVAKPLEKYLMTFKEVKRSKTTSTSQNGLCYIMVELEDNVHDKDEVWSKIKHGLNLFKTQLPSGVAAVIANDDFGDTSALLITIESNSRSYRELKQYMDDLGDKLRTIKSVSNIRCYGMQQEQIGVYLNQEKMSQYGIGEKSIAAAIASQNLTPIGGTVDNKETNTPIHISPSLSNEAEIANQIIWTLPNSKSLMLKDIATVQREYEEPESYIHNNGNRCVIISMEMKAGYNIVEYGKEVDKVLQQYTQENLPHDVKIARIADQAKVVRESVSSFLKDLFLAMIIIIAVMMILFPFRSALVAAITIPLSTFISIAIMYMCGIPLNTVTLAALIVVLGMIVDNSIVVIDGYIGLLDQGHSRWYSAVVSATEFFPSLLLATVCICTIFFPLLIIMSGMMRDFLNFFPWTITINLMVSLLLAVLVIPYLEIVIIPVIKKKGKESFTDKVHKGYTKVLDWTFVHGKLTIGLGVLSIVLAFGIMSLLKIRLMPFADRDQFAVEIYLQNGVSLDRTTEVADSLSAVLKKDKRVKSITSFVGCSSPRFQMSYAPQLAGKNYAQFIVNTKSIKATQEILDKYTPIWSDYFPDAYIKFKQLDYQNLPSLEFRFYGDNIDSLRRASDSLMAYMRQIPELQWVHTDFDIPSAIVDVKLDPISAPQVGINRTLAAANLALASGEIKVGSVWENDYEMPVVIKAEERKRTIAEVGNIQMATIYPTVSIPLKEIASVKPEWGETKIVHRNGVRCMTVTTDIKKSGNAIKLFSTIHKFIEKKLTLPDGVRYETGGEREFDMETLPQIGSSLLVSLIIIFFFILINFKKFGITIVVMTSMSLCLFGAVLGLWIGGYTIGLTAVLGFITLLGMIVRNVILMYQHAENKRNLCHWSAVDAAYDAGKRRMVPIFLTTSTTAVGVIPMIIENSTFWAPVGMSIFAGGIGALILVITVLPVLYSKIYK